VKKGCGLLPNSENGVGLLITKKEAIRVAGSSMVLFLFIRFFIFPLIFNILCYFIVIPNPGGISEVIAIDMLLILFSSIDTELGSCSFVG
jgi:hypothetical protein